MSSLTPRTGGIIAKHLLLLLGGLLIGLFYGQPLAGIAIAALIAAAWHVFHLVRLLRWLRAPADTLIPAGVGPWPTIFSRIHHERRTVAKMRQRQVDMLREWRDLTNALADAGFVLNSDFQIVQHNESAIRMFSLGDNDVVGLHVTNIIRNPAFVDAIQNGAHDKPVHIVPATHPDRTYSCKITRYGIDKSLLMVRDITKSELETRIRADFIANASHELRTPLTVLQGYLNSMTEDEDFDPAWLEPVDEMVEQTERMRDLVTDLLKLNQLESQVEAALDEIAIRKILKQACKDARRLSNDALTIELDCPRGTAILGDKSALRSIVTNLLSNAVRFTPRGGKISVRFWIDAVGGHLAIADSGIGIAEEDIARVTERFYRTDRGRARHQGGTGLGLAIVKHALSLHEGTLEIQSKDSDGTTFYCHFPLSRIAQLPDVKLTALTEDTNHGKR